MVETPMKAPISRMRRAPLILTSNWRNLRLTGLDAISSTVNRSLSCNFNSSSGCAIPLVAMIVSYKLAKREAGGPSNKSQFAGAVGNSLSAKLGFGVVMAAEVPGLAHEGTVHRPYIIGN